MNFTINKKTIVEILGDFSIILKENTVKPIISGISITAENNKLKFVATNLEVDFIKVIEAEVIESGEVVIKPGLILEYIKLLDIENINFNLKDSILFIHQGEFSVLESGQYPILRALEGTEITQLDSQKLKSVLEKVKFSASGENDKLAINVVRACFKKEYSEFVGTDSHRLIYLKEYMEVTNEKSLSLPLDSVNSLGKLLKENSMVKIEYYQNYAIFIWENTYFATKLIELNFPNFEGILSNRNFSKHMEFNNSELKSSLKKVMSISKTSSELKFGATFNFKNKKVEIQATSGKAKVTEKLNMIKNGEDFRSSLNTKYMLEFVQQTEKNVVLQGNTSQAMFQMTELGNENYIYILMPLATRG
ncbi:MAG: DNA polymerase III subunit beta [Fusobacteriaceae bacterium]